MDVDILLNNINILYNRKMNIVNLIEQLKPPVESKELTMDEMVNKVKLFIETEHDNIDEDFKELERSFNIKIDTNTREYKNYPITSASYESSYEDNIVHLLEHGFNKFIPYTFYPDITGRISEETTKLYKKYVKAGLSPQMERMVDDKRYFLATYAILSGDIDLVRLVFDGLKTSDKNRIETYSILNNTDLKNKNFLNYVVTEAQTNNKFNEIVKYLKEIRDKEDTDNETLKDLATGLIAFIETEHKEKIDSEFEKLYNLFQNKTSVISNNVPQFNDYIYNLRSFFKPKLETYNIIYLLKHKFDTYIPFSYFTNISPTIENKKMFKDLIQAGLNPKMYIQEYNSKKKYYLAAWAIIVQDMELIKLVFDKDKLDINFIREIEQYSINNLDELKKECFLEYSKNSPEIVKYLESKGLKHCSKTDKQ